MSVVPMLSVFTFASVDAGAAKINKNYTSTKPAKRKWTAAYNSFYSGYPEIKNTEIHYPDDSNYRIRQELVYPVSYVACDTV